jgi:hypothetical protein
LPGSISAVHLKDRLGDVETDCRNSLHGSSPNRGSLNSTHIHGTHVPVEEPSTASKADIQPDQTSRDEVTTAEQKPRQHRPRSPR